MSKGISFRWLKPVPDVIRDIGINEKTARFAATEWHRLYFPFVPYQEGMLSRQVSYVVRGTVCKIIHLTPYAQRQYYGAEHNFRKSPHALATAYWDRAAITAGKKADLIRAVRAYVKKKG